MATLFHRNNQVVSKASEHSFFTPNKNCSLAKRCRVLPCPQQPNQGQLHIFSIATQVAGGYTNGVAVSPDTGTIFADYDHHNNSYSYQALRTAGIYPGGSTQSNFDIIYKGTEFNWINSWGIIPDNYEANGQVISVYASHKCYQPCLSWLVNQWRCKWYSDNEFYRWHDAELYAWFD